MMEKGFNSTFFFFLFLSRYVVEKQSQHAIKELLTGFTSVSRLNC